MIPVFPKNIEVTLRRDNAAPQCPSVDRCILEVVDEQPPDLLEVIDTGKRSTLLVQGTTRQLIRAKMIPSGHSCHRDYTIKVGLISAGGPITVGEGRTRTTVVHTVLVYVPTGLVISSQIGTTEEEVEPDVEPGTTTDVQTIDNGDSTRTTITTTITVARVRWERRLRGCIDPDEVFLPETPAHLLNARYLGKGGERVALVVWQEATGIWHVLVERRGGQSTEPQLFHHTATPSTDDLWVSAALSPDLSHLYLIESRQSGPDRVASWSRHSWDKYSGSWSTTGSGSVPKPADVLCPNRHTVDRDGLVRGFWASVTRGREEDDNEGDWCVLNGRDIHREYLDHDPVHGGGWSIPSGSWQTDFDRGRGTALQAGDLRPVVERPVSTTQLAISEEYTWTATMTGGSESATWTAYDYTRDQSILRNLGLRFGLQAGGAHLATTRDTGEYLLFSGGCTVHDDQDISDGIHLYFSRKTRMTFDSWEHLDGSVTASVTGGGWVTINTVGQSDVVTDFSPIETSLGPVDHTADAGSYYTPPACPPIQSAIMDRATSTAVATREILHPLALGYCFAIDRSFSAIDQESGDIYVGAQVRATGGSDPVWRVWLDGGFGYEEVTADVAACIGRPLEQLAAIYWRA